VSNVGRPPELEDNRFEPSQLRLIRQVNPEAFWHGLQRAEQPSLMAIFGEALQLRERSMVAGVGQGNASLGVLRVHRPQLSVNQQGNLPAPERPTTIAIGDGYQVL